MKLGISSCEWRESDDHSPVTANPSVLSLPAANPLLEALFALFILRTKNDSPATGATPASEEGVIELPRAQGPEAVAEMDDSTYTVIGDSTSRRRVDSGRLSAS